MSGRKDAPWDGVDGLISDDEEVEVENSRDVRIESINHDKLQDEAE